MSVVPEELVPQVLPPGITRSDVGKLNYQQGLDAYLRLVQALKTVRYDSDQEDRGDYQRYVDRAMTRLQRIEHK